MNGGASTSGETFAGFVYMRCATANNLASTQAIGWVGPGRGVGRAACVAMRNRVLGERERWRRTVNEYDHGLIASISKSMAVMYVRNKLLEDIHAGIEPVSRTGEFTDVMVIDAEDRRIPWPEVSRIGDEEMGRLMR